MRTLVFTIIALCILCAAGCAKNSKKAADAASGEEANRARVEEDAKPTEGEAGSAMADQESVDPGTFTSLTAEQISQVRANIASWAPDYGLEIDTAADAVKPAGSTGKGMPMNSILVKMDQRLTLQKGQPGEISLDDLTRRVLESLKQDTAPAAADAMTPEAQAEQDAAAAASSQAASSGPMLTPAKRVFGEWKSIREISPGHEVEHSDQYFEFMNLWYDGSRAEFRLIRKGELFSVDEFKFAFDAANGELIILDPQTNKELKKYMAYDDINNKNLLYISDDGGKSKKVFTKVGRGGAPLTPEEKAMQDKASGFGSGGKTSK